jgi:hypothetical protein
VYESPAAAAAMLNERRPHRVVAFWTAIRSPAASQALGMALPAENALFPLNCSYVCPESVLVQYNDCVRRVLLV